MTQARRSAERRGTATAAHSRVDRVGQAASAAPLVVAASSAMTPRASDVAILLDKLILTTIVFRYFGISVIRPPAGRFCIPTRWPAPSRSQTDCTFGIV